MQFYLSLGTYSIDHFNSKVKAAILQHKQDWKSNQIKDLKIAIQENYTFSDWFFITLGIPENYQHRKVIFFKTHTKCNLIHPLIQ